MENTIKIIDPSEDKRWNDFVLKHKFGMVYHLSNWSEILKKTFNYKPYYIILEDECGSIIAGLPFMIIKSRLIGNRIISLPRIPYCDPLVENEEDLNLLIQHAREFVNNSFFDFFEIKAQNNYQLLTNLELKYYGHFINQILNLQPGSENLWKQFHRTCIRQRVVRAQKKNVIVRIGKKEKDVKLFYNLYKKTTKKHMAVTRPYIFFKNIWESFDQNTLLLLAEKNGKTAGAAIFFKYKETIFLEFLGLNYELMEFSPGHIIVWEAIRIACSEGFKYLDFGVTPPENKGLYQFKKRWGTQEKILNFFYYPDAKGYKKFIKDSNVTQKNDFPKKIKKKVKRYFAGKLYKHLG